MGLRLSKNPSNFVLLSFLKMVPLNLIMVPPNHYVKIPDNNRYEKIVNNNSNVKKVVVNSNPYVKKVNNDPNVKKVVREKMGLRLSKNPSNFVLLSFLNMVPSNHHLKEVNNNPSVKKVVVNNNPYVKKVNNNRVSLVARTGRHLQRYDTVGYRQVVGCIPYRYRKTNKSEELEVLVISSQKGEGMLFPKGGWEMDEDMKDAALRETFEEAGVRGVVEEELGMWIYKSKRCDIMHNGYMFPLLVNKQLDQWPEQNIRQRKWMTATEAREVCQQGWMKEALNVLISRRMNNCDE